MCVMCVVCVSVYVVCICGYMPSHCVEVRGQLSGVSSLLLWDPGIEIQGLRFFYPISQPYFETGLHYVVQTAPASASQVAETTGTLSSQKCVLSCISAGQCLDWHTCRG